MQNTTGLSLWGEIVHRRDVCHCAAVHENDDLEKTLSCLHDHVFFVST